MHFLYYRLLFLPNQVGSSRNLLRYVQSYDCTKYFATQYL